MPTHVIAVDNTAADPVTGNVPVVQTVYSLKTILTDAQIKALPTTTIELVPAQEGKLFHVLGAFCLLDNQNGGYSNWDSLPFRIFTGTDNQVLNAVADPIEDTDGPVWYIKFDNEIGIYNNVPIVQGPISLKLTNPSGDLTGGDPANTLAVTVFYSIVDL